MSMQAILVAMDGSAGAQRALKFAIEVAKSGKKKLRVVHVLPRIKSSRLMPQSLIDDHYDRETESALKPASSLLKRAKVVAEIETCFGDAAPALVSYARKHHCGHIVMGNRGHGAIAGLLIGSVAMKVLHLADVPVTLVK